LEADIRGNILQNTTFSQKIIFINPVKHSQAKEIEDRS